MSSSFVWLQLKLPVVPVYREGELQANLLTTPTSLTYCVMSCHVLVHSDLGDNACKHNCTCDHVIDLGTDFSVRLPDQQGGKRPTHLSCSPVTRTSASRSSSAAFFCMVWPIPSMMSLLKQEAGLTCPAATHAHHSALRKCSTHAFFCKQVTCYVATCAPGEKHNEIWASGLKNKDTQASTRW